MGYLKGGAFLIQETEAKDIFIRSEFGEDQKMMLSATEDFNEREIRPVLMRFEEKDYALVESLMRKAGAKDYKFYSLKKAQENNSRLKFVAKLNKGKASVGLESVGTEHPFYNLVGSDNITVFYTERYKDSPLVVKGAGAGGEFTASGVFADIIKASQGNG